MVLSAPLIMDVHEALKASRPCRAYQPRPVPDEVLKRVLGATRFAATSNDQQPWRFLVIQDEELKRKVVQAVNRGQFLAQAPVLVLALGVEEAAPSLVGNYMMSYTLEVAASIQVLTLAAAAEGLGACWWTDFREERLRSIFHIPEGVHVVGVIPLGFPEPGAGGNGHEGRKSFSEIVAFNEFAW